MKTFHRYLNEASIEHVKISEIPTAQLSEITAGLEWNLNGSTWKNTLSQNGESFEDDWEAQRLAVKYDRPNYYDMPRDQILRDLGSMINREIDENQPLSAYPEILEYLL